MSTSWFAIDSEGEVALLEFGEEGPLPVVVPPEQLMEDIIWGQHTRWAEDGLRETTLTPDQLAFFLSIMHIEPFDPQKHHIIPGIWFIDMARMERFRPLAEYLRESIVVLSREHGIYYVGWDSTCEDEDWSDYIDQAEEWVLREGFVLRYANPEDIDTEYRRWIDGDTSLIESFPHYVYHQEDYCYSPELRRVNAYSAPIRADQLSESYRAKALRLPMSFRECESFSIDDYYPSHHHRQEKTLPPRDRQGRRIALSITDPGSMWFNAGHVLLSGYEREDILQRMGRTDVRLWMHSPPCRHCDYPTIAIIRERHRGYLLVDTPGEIAYRALVTTYLPFDFDFRSRAEDNPGSELELTGWLEQRVWAYRLFSDFLERLLTYYHPYVLILEEDVLEVLSCCHQVGDGTIELGGETYPFFLYESIARYTAEILSLAEKPYRGDLRKTIYFDED